MSTLKAFDSLYDHLKISLTTDDVIGSCFACHIITNSEREAVQAAGTAGHKAAVLLDAVRRSIIIDPSSFETFLNILSSEAKYNSLVRQIRNKVQKLTSAKQRLDATPSMVELLCFSDRKRNIVVEIGAKYATFGIFLLEDKTGAIVEALEMEHHQNAERINMAILQQWLQGRGVKPVTWSTLVTVLQRIGMGSLAYEIASEIDDTKKLYDEAMRNGYVDREIIKCLIIGAAGVGKTTIKHLLLGKEPPKKRVSTGVLENPVRAVSISMAGECSSGSWCKVESDEELMKMIAEAIKSGKVPKENILVGSQNDAVAEHNDDIMLPATDIESSTVRPADVHIEPEYNEESIHSEFIEAINNSEGSETFLSTRWIHFIDSGGQPEFHDLLPLFIPNTSVVIFVFKLSESLHHKPKVEYVGSSGPIGDPYDSYLTHKEILEHSLKTFHEPSGQSPTIVVVGTHKDCEQKLEIEDLKKCLNHIKSSLVHFGSEPIALVDCLSQHGQEREDIMEGIRSSIMEAAADKIRSQKTPLAWFGLEMELKKASKPKAGILSIDECKKQADKFPFFKKNRGQFDAALKHLIEHNIFLHYPTILPDIVFCDPQVLLTEVTRIVQHHYMLKNSTRPRRGDMISFVQNGYISTNILKNIHRNQNCVEPELFLKLLSELNIISAIHTIDFYLMPALLSNTENPALTVASIDGKETFPPLCISFDGGCAPSGLFCSLVAHLLHSEDWKLYIKSGTPRCCFHNCVAYIYGDETIVTLMDLFTHFRILIQSRIMWPCAQNTKVFISAHMMRL